MRFSPAALLAALVLLASRSAHAQQRDQLYSAPLVEAAAGRSARPAAASPSLQPARIPTPHPTVERGRATGWLIAGGGLGAGVGTIVGMGVGAFIDGPADPDCIDFCFGPGLIIGTVAGEVLGIAAGVHLANGRSGSRPWTRWPRPASWWWAASPAAARESCCSSPWARSSAPSPRSAPPRAADRPHRAGQDRPPMRVPRGGESSTALPGQGKTAMMRTFIPLSASFLTAALAVGSVYAQEPVPPHETFTIQSAVLGETRRINVYTPPGYQPGGAEHPVLYMPDGGVQEDFPHVAAAVDAAIRAGEMRRMIVVGIENTERRRDMTPPTEVEEDRRIAPRVGGSAAFRRFIRDELMPEVRRRYRATDETGIIGESLAGLFIVETFFVEPELFDTYVALSPSLWWNAGELVRSADARLAAPPPPSPAFRPMPTVLYLSSADEENIAPAAARLAEALRANAPDRYRWQYRPRPELTHATIYRAEAPRVLRDLFPPVR
jgi:predicted alpha/beta superfamily hydrolase